MGLEYYHTYDSQRSQPGFPDLVIVGEHGVLFRELKTESGRLTPMQVHWLHVLTLAGQNARLWRPSDLPAIQAELKALGRVQAQRPVKLPKKYSPNKA